LWADLSGDAKNTLAFEVLASLPKRDDQWILFVSKFNKNSLPSRMPWSSGLPGLPTASPVFQNSMQYLGQ
jgi:hypothetical protein